MATNIAVIVSLKIPDVIAHTAQTTLTRRMGCAALERLRREEVYFLTLDAAAGAEAEALARRLIAETSCFVNPNKHEYVLHAGELATLKGAGDNAATVRVLVEWLEDGTAALLSESLGKDPRFGGKVLGVRRGTLWTLTFASGQSDPRGLALDLAVARDTHTGLLANPHAQRATVL